MYKIVFYFLLTKQTRFLLFLELIEKKSFALDFGDKFSETKRTMLPLF